MCHVFANNAEQIFKRLEGNFLSQSMVKLTTYLTKTIQQKIKAIQDW